MTDLDRQSRIMMTSLFGLTAGVLSLVMILAWPFNERLPDFDRIQDVNEKKSAFFNYLLPFVEAENARLAELRRAVEAVASRQESGRPLDREDRRLLEVLAEHYELAANDPGEPGFIDALLRRVDRIPPSLVLAQAAMESGWGTSRFARRGLNLFGHWCDEPGCGLVPAKRREGATHEVAAFDSVRESVRKYMRNLNSHRAYEAFRDRRAELRRQGQPLSGPALAGALGSYSERGSDYIADIRGLIASNELVACTRDPEVAC